MKFGVGGRVAGVRMGVSSRGYGVGVGPVSAGGSWHRRGRRGGSSSGGATLFALVLMLAAVVFVVGWPYLLGTWIAVKSGAANPSTARTAVGWILEVPWLGLLVLLSIAAVVGKRSPKVIAGNGQQSSAPPVVSVGGDSRYVRLASDYRQPSVPLWLDGSVAWSTSTGWENSEVLAAAAGRLEIAVEAIPEPGNPHDSTAVALDIDGHRVGYLRRGVSGGLCRAIQRLNAAGYRVFLHGRIDGCAPRHSLEVRGSWPGDIMAWLKLPADVRDSYFELNWQKTGFKDFYQSRLATAVASETDLVVDCTFRPGNRTVDPYVGMPVGSAGSPAMPKGGTYIDIYLGELHVGEIRGDRILDRTAFGRRVGAGRLAGLAKLRRWNDNIELQVVASEPDGSFPRRVAPFLWSDEQQEQWRRQLERTTKARDAEVVDGIRLPACRHKLAEMKRAGQLEDARALAMKMVDAARASAAIETRRPQSWVTIEAAIVLRKTGEVQSEVDVLEDYVRSCPPDDPPEDKVLDRLTRAKHALSRRNA